VPTSLRTTLCILLLVGTSSLLAQSPQNRLDLAATYSAERSLNSNTSQNFWIQGGSVELGANVWHGLGIAADVTGTHSSSIGNNGSTGNSVPLSLVTVAFGPRYRWHADHRIAIYGEGLIGEANGFRSLFPTQVSQQPDANSFATQLGGGVDYRLSDRFAIRVLDAAWMRTQLPNSTDNVQNILRLGAGIVLRFAPQ
jgi:opacity protein-like surface antigen